MNGRSIIASFLVLSAAIPSAGSHELLAPGRLHVAVYEQSGNFHSLVDVLNSDPGVRARIITQPQVESGLLSRFDCMVARMWGAGEPTEATVQAIRDFVGLGRGYIGEWWGAGGALSEVVPSGDNFEPPERFLALFSGGASGGGFVQRGNPITVVQEHPVVEGLPDVFSGGGGTEYFVRAVEPHDPALATLATYEGFGGTYPAVMVGETGSFTNGHRNAVLLFFDAIDEPAQPNLTILWLNSVKFACVSQPEPLT